MSYGRQIFVSLLLCVLPGYVAASATGADFMKLADCTAMRMPMERKFSCNGYKAEECALAHAIDAANGLQRCDRKIAAYAWIGATLGKAETICAFDCRPMARDIFWDLFEKLPKIDDLNARIRAAWAVAMAMISLGEYGLPEVIAQRLQPDLRATILAHGAWHAALRCKPAKMNALLEEARTAAGQSPNSAMKVRAYSWMARTYLWLGSEDSINMMRKARITLNALPPGNERRWGRVYYAAGLAATGNEKAQDEILFGMGEPYDRALVLSYSAVIYGFFRKQPKGRATIDAADKEAKLVTETRLRDNVLAVLAQARILAGLSPNAGAVLDRFSVSRAYQRIADGLIELQTGVYERSCGDWK